MVERVRLLIELTSFSYEGSNPSFSAPENKFRLLYAPVVPDVPKEPKTPSSHARIEVLAFLRRRNGYEGILAKIPTEFLEQAINH